MQHLVYQSRKISFYSAYTLVYGFLVPSLVPIHPGFLLTILERYKLVGFSAHLALETAFLSSQEHQKRL